MRSASVSGPLRLPLGVKGRHGGTSMRILLIASAYNSMTQRVHAELADRGHEVSIELALGDEVMRDGVRRYDPDLIIAPMLTRGDSRGHLVGLAVLHRPPGP